MRVTRVLVPALALLAYACGGADSRESEGVVGTRTPTAQVTPLADLALTSRLGDPLMEASGALAWGSVSDAAVSEAAVSDGGERERDSGPEKDSASADDASEKDAPAKDASEKDAPARSDAADASSPHDTGPVSPTYAGLHAVKGAITDAQGRAVLIHGVNRSGSEFACVDGYGFFDGPTDVASIAAMKSWNINAVRVPLNEDCWLGINGVSATYAGANYRAAIEGYVELLLANEMIPIVDLHWNAPGAELATGQEPMADADHAPAFWTSVSDAFKTSGNVVFELYNEPYPDNNQDTTAAWTCWRDGGSCPSVPFPVAGMQTLVSAVRATGATNLILLGGVEYSNALTQWAAYKPSDSLENLAAAWHVYQGNLCSDATCFEAVAAPLAKSFPIVATEVGDSACDGAFMTTVAAWLDTNGQGYSAWTWNAWGAACANYSLVTDYTGTPNGAYGVAYRSHLLAL